MGGVDQTENWREAFVPGPVTTQDEGFHESFVFARPHGSGA